MTDQELISPSLINTERLGGQNKRLYAWLLAGNTIHVFHPAKQALRIGYINSRISDLCNKHNITVKKKYITVKDTEGEPVSVVEYSL